MALSKFSLIALSLFINFTFISLKLNAAEETTEPVENLLPAQKAQPAIQNPAPVPTTSKKEKRFFGS